jgi:hypothetical protein
MVLVYVYHHLPKQSPSYVGKYTSTMEHMGYTKHYLSLPLRYLHSPSVSYLSWMSCRVRTSF